MPVTTSAAPARVRARAERPPCPTKTPRIPERAPAAQRRRCASSASRHTTAAPTSTTSNGTTNMLPKEPAATNAPMPSMTTAMVCWRSLDDGSFPVSTGRCGTKAHSRA